MGKEDYSQYQFEIRGPILGNLDTRPAVMIKYDLLKGFPKKAYSIGSDVEMIRDFFYIDEQRGQVRQFASRDHAQIFKEEQIFKKDEKLLSRSLTGNIEVIKSGIEKTLLEEIFPSREVMRIRGRFEDAEAHAKKYRQEAERLKEKLAKAKTGKEDKMEIHPLSLIGLSLTTGFFTTHFITSRHSDTIISIYNDYLRDYIKNAYEFLF